VIASLRYSRLQICATAAALAFWLLASLCLAPNAARAGEVMPAAPKQYFNDYAHVVSPATAARLNQTLEQFERDTSDQILVVVYPKMQSDSSVEDYTVRVAQSWKVGQKGRDNGAVLFVFIQDRKMLLQVGYGLEGALPDALAKRIIETEIKPRFRNGDYDGGLSAGVTAILAATRGEYKGTGATVAESRGQSSAGPVILFVVIFGIFGLFILASAMNTGRRRRYGGWGWTMGGGGFSSSSWGGGGFSSGSWGGGGGGFSSGGFSGGGGSFGGGGAGGSW